MEELKMMLRKSVREHEEAVYEGDMEGEVRAAVKCAVGILELAQKYPDQRAAILEFVFAYEPLLQFDSCFYEYVMRHMDHSDYIALVPALRKSV